MYHPRLYGNFYDMGFKYGSLLHQKKIAPLSLTQRQAEFGTECYQSVSQFYPELIEEFEGFAAGWQWEADQLGAFVSGLGVFDMTGKCSAFAGRTSDAIIFGRNYDLLYKFRKTTESCLIAPQDKFAYVSQSDVFIGRCDGVNEMGLAIAMSFVNGTQIQPGITFHLIIRKVLETCRTVADAIALIQSAKVASANNFLIADAARNMAVVESAPQGSEVRHPAENENFVCITNQFQHPRMQPFDQGGIGWCQSAERYQHLCDRLGQCAQIDMETAQEILSTTPVCLDLRREQFGTLWSVVANLNMLAIARAEGKPKITNYRPDTRLTWWLQKGNP
ncbi:C45 family autoproteolytic acyltransferase/hydrolase [Oscillatoria sp. CS-180]|uniref:C45 family autoproteolytic acyltransferase/hydolase n=1 Tax=Oscillatoria sp. CS-180 TaxID=3021720 RepID=UPI0023309AA1|nr:C45 family peptidase [Oscillatoria sp. CS-180]MDB9524785.1 C45 family autoproteolytic acyltransferase/hydrolase [Oscillatoria sp. CS-180]